MTAATAIGADIKLGITLYSLSNEWVTGAYTLDSLVARVAEAGIGPGIEIVGFQSIRGFPEVSSDFVTNWRRMLDEHGLEASCLGSNIDVAIRSDRFLTTEESADYLARQIRTASLLGFPVVRIQMGATPAVIEKVTPLAEKAGIRLGMEIHAPEGAQTPAVLRIREAYDRIGSENLGFIPDFSSTMHSIPAGQIEAFIAAGMPEDLGPELQSIWKKAGHPQERFGEFADLARSRDVAEDVIQSVQIGFSMFGHEDPATWIELVPQTFHVHAKFYDIDDAGTEPSIDYATIIPQLVAGGYRGYISSEWEGHGFRDVGEVDPIELLRRHHDLERRVLAAAGYQSGPFDATRA